MLELVRPPGTKGQPTPPTRRKGGRSVSLSLTPEETQHFRAAVRNIARVHFGTLVKLAAAVGVPPGTIKQALIARRRPSVALAFRIARAAKVPLESMLYPTVGLAGSCPTCGRKGDGVEMRGDPAGSGGGDGALY